LEQLAAKLQALAKNGNQEQLMVRADTNVPYGAVMEVMGVLNTAGYSKIGLVTSTKDKVPAAN
jgi:biopolymer transport protein TolR